MLTLREKRFAEKLLQESQKVNTAAWHEWASSLLFAVGGVAVVLACLETMNSLGAQSIKFILIPGITAGMAFLFVGAYGLHLSKKDEERRLLAGVLKKFTA